MLQAQRIDPAQLTSLSEIELRELAGQLLERIDRDAREIHWRDAKIEKQTFEMAQLRRVKFGVKSEQLDAQQKTCSRRPSTPTWRPSKRSSPN